MLDILKVEQMAPQLAMMKVMRMVVQMVVRKADELAVLREASTAVPMVEVSDNSMAV